LRKEPQRIRFLLCDLSVFLGDSLRLNSSFFLTAEGAEIYAKNRKGLGFFSAIFASSLGDSLRLNSSFFKPQ
ncbi:hypothetical protein, partial [Peijinzhouia sedimentorum]